MDTSDVYSFGRALYEAQGAKAIAYAAQKVEQFEKAGDKEQALHWQRVEAVVRELRGPRES